MKEIYQAINGDFEIEIAFTTRDFRNKYKEAGAFVCLQTKGGLMPQYLNVGNGAWIKKHNHKLVYTEISKR